MGYHSYRNLVTTFSLASVQAIHQRIMRASDRGHAGPSRPTRCELPATAIADEDYKPVGAKSKPRVTRRRHHQPPSLWVGDHVVDCHLFAGHQAPGFRDLFGSNGRFDRRADTACTGTMIRRLPTSTWAGKDKDHLKRSEVTDKSSRVSLIGIMILSVSVSGPVFLPLA